MCRFSHNDWVQKEFEYAIEKVGLEKVLEGLCNYVCDEDVSEFIGYFCDNHNCFPPDEEF